MHELEAARRKVWARLAKLAVPTGLAGLTIGCGAPQAEHGAHHERGEIAVQVGRLPLPTPAKHEDEHAHEHEDERDHAAEEFARCLSGTWCGEIRDAKLFWVEGAETALRCPLKLVPNPTLELPPGDTRFKGLSQNINMRASLDREATLAQRESGEASADTCCYDWLEHCLGRPPLTHAGALVPPAAREQWLTRAQLEWFSVVSFLRMARALARRGAPRALVQAHIRAAEQEQVHAQLCCELAGIDASSLPDLPELEPLDDALLVREALVSGAIGESLAVAEALAEARSASGRTREVWAQIAEDEAGHAALGLAVVAWWAEREGPGAVRAQLRELEAAGLGEQAQRALGQIVTPVLEQLEVVSTSHS